MWAAEGAALPNVGNTRFLFLRAFIGSGPMSGSDRVPSSEELPRRELLAGGKRGQARNRCPTRAPGGIRASAGIPVERVLESLPIDSTLQKDEEPC